MSLDRVERDSRAFKLQTKMVTVRVRSAELAQLALDDRVAGKLARRIDATTLLIPAGRQTAFRNALRNLGYGLRTH